VKLAIIDSASEQRTKAVLDILNQVIERVRAEGADDVYVMVNKDDDIFWSYTGSHNLFQLAGAQSVALFKTMKRISEET